MITLSHVLLVAAGTTATGSLAVVYTMKEFNIASARLILLLKVWGIGMLFAVPLGWLSAIMQ